LDPPIKPNALLVVFGFGGSGYGYYFAIKPKAFPVFGLTGCGYYGC